MLALFAGVIGTRNAQKGGIPLLGRAEALQVEGLLAEGYKASGAGPQGRGDESGEVRTRVERRQGAAAGVGWL